MAVSPPDLQRVLDTVARNAARVCDGLYGVVFRVDGAQIRLAAHHGLSPTRLERLTRQYPRGLDDEGLAPRAIREAAVIHCPDIQSDPRATAWLRETAQAEGFRSMVVVPMLRDGQALGTLVVSRPEGGFTERQIQLLRAFADQAVIAIENVRLFQELEARNRELTEGLERETATADLLRIISASPTDLAPVFESILDRALLLCGATMGAIGRCDGGLVLADPVKGPPDLVAAVHAAYPRRLTDSGAMVRAIRERRTMQVADICADPAALPIPGIRGQLMVPMLKDGEALGAIVVSRPEPGLFSPAHVKLLETFADQAVIAIENVRLFRELRARNRELTESLEQQTATSEILRAISGSPTDVQPVFETIARSAVRLCEGGFGGIVLLREGLLHLVALHNFTPEAGDAFRSVFPIPVVATSSVGRAILSRDTDHVADLNVGPGDGPTANLHKVTGYRSQLSVPLLREGTPVGVIAVGRPEPGLFSVGQVGLLRTFADQAVIAIENVRLFQELEARNRELRRALEREQATGEVLRVIGGSPTSVEPVFEAILTSAMRLCDTPVGLLFLYDGETFQLAAHRGAPAAFVEPRRTGFRPSPHTGIGRAVRERQPVQIADLTADIAYTERDEARMATVDLLGARTAVWVPMLREGAPVGVLCTWRREVQAFTDSQVDLLATFAAQAVIAMENARLFQELQARNRELTEALEQQTATAEILRVISTSPTNLQPVLDAVVKSAARFCGAPDASVFRLDGGTLRAVAHHGPVSQPAGFPVPVVRGTVAGRSLLERRAVDVTDLQVETEEFPEGSALARRTGQRATLGVPLLREEVPIGVLLLRRGEAVPFTAKQIELLKTFADQAVIAIENVRLFTELDARNRELTESLEQQTATAAILRVISGSPTDIQPVLDAVAESATRLCEARDVSIALVDRGVLKIAASHGPMARWWPEGGIPIGRGSVTGRAIVDRRTIHIHDLAAESDEEFPEGKIYQRQGGIRTNLAVPLLREGVAIGLIAMRRAEVRPFTDRQVRLLETFADQAVIAIENVRLFQELERRNRELTETLEQQTATAEILGVISRSPTNLDPVLKTVARNASRLCGAANVSLYRVEGGLMRKVAEEGPPLTTLRVGETRPITRTSISGRAIVDQATIHVPDYQSEEAAREYPDVRRDSGIQTTIGIPLLREGMAIGSFTAYRTESRPFSEREIALLQTFADQAVIAIENVRLFTELEARNRELTESLEQQTATAEILRVISSSPTDLAPVMAAVTQNAARLAGADHALIGEAAEGRIRWLATSGCPLVSEGPSISRQLPSGRAILDCQTTQVEDVIDLTVDFPGVRRAYDEFGVRTILATPLVRETQAIGVLLVRRTRVQPFTGKEVELLRTFADQAVIAIENVRLFTELEARNRELTESLEQQTATAEILGVISRSPTDTQPVFDGIIASAVRLCDARIGAIYRIDQDTIDIVATADVNDEARETHRAAYPMPVASLQPPFQRVVSTAEPLHVVDIDADPEFSDAFRERARTLGYRTALVVPMCREGRVIGLISVGRIGVGGVPRPYSDREIGLLRTFADQAVIAIENVRLFQELEARNRELTESLEQQTATAEILRAISASPTDTQPVFDSIAHAALRLCDGAHCVVHRFDGALVHLVAQNGLSVELLEEFRRVYPAPLAADTLPARAIREGRIIHRADLLDDPSEPVRRLAQTGRYRSGIVVPMLRSGSALGVISVARSDPAGGPRPYTEKEIALLRTFADQAVIAVENVRLFRELEARTRELARSVEELQALSDVGRAVSSTLDLPTVLSTIVARAVQLSGTSGGVVYEYDEASQAFQLRASHRTEDELVEVLRATPIRLGEGATGQTVLRRAPVEITDILADQQAQATPVRAVFVRLGYRSVLSIPLLLESRPLGALTVWRREAGSFPPETMNLLQTFATQSVLAIQNARLFREIEAKGRELEIASRHKSQFLANMSHELRTPLNAILGYTELMIDGIYGELAPKAGDVMGRIDRSGKHLLGLINDVLDLSKIEAGQLELALADYSLAEIVNAVATQVESLASEKRLTLEVKVAPDLPAGRGDERRLAQVLLNLVGNALKFTEVGSVRVAAYRDGDAFVVSVADTGPGIAEADRQRIFEEFQQADSSSTRKKGGTGLGLSIARRIVELHGGRIWVESTVGRGSTFSFRVPVRVERQAVRA
jgi:GAF domain-containing protein